MIESTTRCGLLLVLMVATTSVGARAQSASRLETLTPAASALPAGCAYVPSPTERIGERQLRSGLWGGLPIRSNPWAGDTWRPVSEIKNRLFGPSLMKDAPADLRSAAALERSLVTGMSGYAAFYVDGDARIAVYALSRGEEPLRWTPSPVGSAEPGTGPAAVKLGNRQVAVLVTGDRGPCFTAIEQHLRTAVGGFAGERDAAGAPLR